MQNKMNPELKAKWLEALRSGKYKQGTGSLRAFDNRYCCLGVLADVINPEKWENKFGWWQWEGGRNNIPYDLRAEIGFNMCSEGKPGTDDHLIGMNDGIHSVRYSFEEIANWIEKNL